MNVRLDYMTWPELEENLKDIKLAIIPTGSCEQHGPNQTFTTDTARVHETARLIGEKLYPNVLVCPTVPYGISPHHMAFPGTITLDVETYINLLTDIAVCLKEHGINNILFLNGHGGNKASLGAVCAKLYHEHKIKCAFSGSGSDVTADFWAEKELSKVRGHACEAEVSQSLFLAPEVVRKDALTPGILLDERYTYRVPWAQYFWPFDEVTGNGALGDATKATIELGEEMSDLVVERVSEFIKVFFLND